MKLKKQNPMILLALIMLILTIYNIYSFKTEEVKKTEDYLSSAMKANLGTFENWLFNYINSVDLIKSQLNQLTLSELSYSSSDNKYLTYNFSSEFKHEIYIGFRNGDFISNTNWLPPDNYDPRERPWYQDTLKENKTIISNVYVDHISNNSVIAITTPIYIQDNFEGVLGTDLYLDDLNKMFFNIRSSDNFEPFAINAKGIILADTADLSQINQKIHDQYTTLFNKAKADFEYHSEIIDDHNLYVYYYSDKLNWLLGSKVDLDIYTQRLEFWIRPQTIVNLLFWILFMGVLFYIHKLSDRLILTTTTLEQKNASLKVINAKLENANNLLEFRAVHDSLTGLYNRFAFDDLLDELISKGFQERKYIGIILFDVDDFKAYNDIYGHVQGDEALARLAKEVSQFCKHALMTARYGGEEFAIIYYDQDIDELESISTEIIELIRSLRIPHKLSNHGYITISGGVNAIIPSLTTSRGMFIHQADTALYKAKANGKNQFVKAYTRN